MFARGGEKEVFSSSLVAPSSMKRGWAGGKKVRVVNSYIMTGYRNLSIEKVKLLNINNILDIYFLLCYIS